MRGCADELGAGFAWNGDGTVANEVVGDGPIDLVYMPGFINNLEIVWDNPLIARFLKRLASFSRLMIDGIEPPC